MLIGFLLACGTARAAKGEEWRVVDPRVGLTPYLAYRQDVFFGIGFHLFPAIHLEGGRAPVEGVQPGAEEFRHALLHNFSPAFLGSAVFDVGYGYRFAKHFRLMGAAGFLTQRFEEKLRVEGNAAVAQYSYIAGTLVVIPEARFPVSMLDFFIGAGAQATWYNFVARIRGSSVGPPLEPGGPPEGDGFRLFEAKNGPAFGAVGRAGLEYRVRDNWGLHLEYRYAYVPATFAGEPFDHGGHYGMLTNLFHFQ